MMKKTIALILAAAMLCCTAACGSEKTDAKSAGGIDVDLTALSSTMVYAEVSGMLMNPQDYIGKTVKMSGQFTLFQAVDESGNAVPDMIYYACIVADATACCQQGIEFILGGDKTYPDDYPELDSEITVVGEFQTYLEGTNQYCHLVNARII